MTAMTTSSSCTRQSFLRPSRPPSHCPHRASGGRATSPERSQRRSRRYSRSRHGACLCATARPSWPSKGARTPGTSKGRSAGCRRYSMAPWSMPLPPSAITSSTPSPPYLPWPRGIPPHALATPSISPLATWHPHLARPPRSHSLVPRGRYPRIYVAEETLARQRSFRQEPSTASTHEPSARPPSVPPTALDEPARLIMYLPPQGGANETGNPGNWYSKPPLSTFYCPSYCPWCHMACPPHPIALCATWQVRARRAARPAHAPGVRARCARPAAAAAAGLQQRCALRPGRSRAEPIPPTAAMGPRAASQRRHHVQGRRRQWQAHHPLSTSLDATWHALLTLPPLTPRGRQAHHPRQRFLVGGRHRVGRNLPQALGGVPRVAPSRRRARWRGRDRRR